MMACTYPDGCCYHRRCLSVFLCAELVPPLRAQMVVDSKRDEIGGGGRLQPHMASALPDMSELLLPKRCVQFIRLTTHEDCLLLLLPISVCCESCCRGSVDGWHVRIDVLPLEGVPILDEVDEDNDADENAGTAQADNAPNEQARASELQADRTERARQDAEYAFLRKALTPPSSLRINACVDVDIGYLDTRLPLLLTVPGKLRQRLLPLRRQNRQMLGHMEGSKTRFSERLRCRLLRAVIHLQLQ